MLRLSQGHLNLLTTCPRKFQYIALDQLGTPTPPEQQERMAWGDRFHRLMQQQELGLLADISSDAAKPDPEQPIRDCVTALSTALAQALPPNPRLRQSEHRRGLDYNGWAIAAIYDLLILYDHQAHIFDWKTYARPQNTQFLAQNWQTRLYPFVLAETTDYQPAQIAMTYWFVQPGEPPKSLHFPYSDALHEQTRQDLSQIFAQLGEWLRNYDEGQFLPQIDIQKGHCRTCPFAVRCQRLIEPNDSGWLTIAEIAEVAID
jgi:hypothetical protein